MLDSQMKKILICAVPFSDNLGDGVIAASLAHIAGLKYPQARVEFLDIAGRLGFEEENLRGGGAFRLFAKLPSFIRSVIVFLYCLKGYFLGWRKNWKAAVDDADRRHRDGWEQWGPGRARAGAGGARSG